MSVPALQRDESRAVRVPVDSAVSPGVLDVPDDAQGVVNFRSSRRRSRTSRTEQHVARTLRTRGLARLLIDLLAHDELLAPPQPGQVPPAPELVAGRLITVSEWLRLQPEIHGLQVGYFDGGPFGNAVLLAAADRPEALCAIVACGSWPELASAVMSRVQTPILLLDEVSDSKRFSSAVERLAVLNCDWFRCLFVPGNADDRSSE